MTVTAREGCERRAYCQGTSRFAIEIVIASWDESLLIELFFVTPASGRACPDVTPLSRCSPGTCPLNRRWAPGPSRDPYPAIRPGGKCD